MFITGKVHKVLSYKMIVYFRFRFLYNFRIYSRKKGSTERENGIEIKKMTRRRREEALWEPRNVIEKKTAEMMLKNKFDKQIIVNNIANTLIIVQKRTNPCSS